MPPLKEEIWLGERGWWAVGQATWVAVGEKVMVAAWVGDSIMPTASISGRAAADFMASFCSRREVRRQLNGREGGEGL